MISPPNIFQDPEIGQILKSSMDILEVLRCESLTSQVLITEVVKMIEFRETYYWLFT